MMMMTRHEMRPLTPSNSVAETISVMGRAAVDASRIFALAEWARGEAALAPRRDYVAQLRRIFDALARRWRYVMESEEWVHGDGVSIIRIVLGTKYNGDPDLRRTSLAAIPTRRPGWGDCDDISQAVAAAVLAIGMTPFFRVVMGPRGGHVSVLARTPRGQVVSLDPVGLPEHRFGWMMPAAPEHVTIWGMSGERVTQLGCPDTGAQNAMNRAERSLRPVAVIPRQFEAARPSVMSSNALAIRRGDYLSCAPCMLAGDELGSIKDVARRWKKRARAVRGVVKKVRRLHNKIVAKILSNKVAQKIVGTVLMAYGVPPLVAPAVMRMGAEIIANDGLIGFVKRLKKDPKLAIKMVQEAVKKGLIPKNALTGKAAQIAKSLSGNEYAFTRMIPLGASDWAVALSVPDQAAESKNVKIALSDRPASSRGQRRKPGQTESDWLTNVVLWETYPGAPIDLDTKKTSHKPYVTAWIRISKNVKNGLAVKKTSTQQKQSFAINTQENAIADEAVAQNPKSQMHRGSQQTREKGQTSSDWLANVAYWRAYPEGPTVIRNDKPHSDAWRRLAARVNAQLKKTTTPTTKTTTPTTKTTTPKTTTPKTTTPTTKTTTPKLSTNCWEDERRQMSICQDVDRNPEELAIAKRVAQQRPTSEVVAGTSQRRRSGQSEADWLANVAYWRVYPEGPIEIPGSAPQYAEAWSRISSEVRRSMKTTPKLPTTPKDPKLPDLDPGPNKLPDLDPHVEPKQTNWLPIVAGAAALLLALKGA